MTKRIAVCILNYNGAQLLRQFLPSVIDFSPEANIYVIDNQSTDESLKVLKEEFSEVDLIINEENYGFTGGYNHGLKHVGEELIVLLNSDVEVTKNWLVPLISTFEDQSVAACQPKILAQRQKGSFEYAGASGGFIDWLGYPYCRGRIFETIEEDHGQYDEPIQIFWASGACMVVRKEVFEQVGGFDLTFFAHMEEIDLCWRMQTSGYRIMSNPSSIVYHVGGETLSKENPRKTYLNFRNSATMLYKNTYDSSVYWKFALKMSLDLTAAFKFWKDNTFAHFMAVINAYVDFFKDLRAKRIIKYEQAVTKNATLSTIDKKIIVIQYYLQGKKKFSDLVR
ncbi:MAG: glycosyltransferase family 2 protein [Bacteroidota bacterium]